MIVVTAENITCGLSTIFCFISLMLLLIFMTLKIEFFGALLGITVVLGSICCLMTLSLHGYEEEKKKKQIYPIVKPIEKVTVITHTYPYHT